MNGVLGLSVGSVSHSAPSGLVRIRRVAPIRTSHSTLIAAKLPYSNGDSTSRKQNLQTSATNPAVTAAAAMQPDMAMEERVERLEKLYTLSRQEQVSLSRQDNGSLDALVEVEALLEDLKGLDLTSALEIAREDLTDLTVRKHVVLFHSDFTHLGRIVPASETGLYIVLHLRMHTRSFSLDCVYFAE